VAASGTVGVQPSELAKPALVIFLAFFVTWRARAINNPRYTLVPRPWPWDSSSWRWWCGSRHRGGPGAAAAAVFIVAGLEWRYCAIAGAVAAVGW